MWKNKVVETHVTEAAGTNHSLQPFRLATADPEHEIFYSATIPKRRRKLTINIPLEAYTAVLRECV
jgi:hypothetical protein